MASDEISNFYYPAYLIVEGCQATIMSDDEYLLAAGSSPFNLPETNQVYRHTIQS